MTTSIMATSSTATPSFVECPSQTLGKGTGRQKQKLEEISQYLCPYRKTQTLRMFLSLSSHFHGQGTIVSWVTRGPRECGWGSRWIRLSDNWNRMAPNHRIPELENENILPGRHPVSACTPPVVGNTFLQSPIHCGEALTSKDLSCITSTALALSSSRTDHIYSIFLQSSGNRWWPPGLSCSFRTVAAAK